MKFNSEQFSGNLIGAGLALLILTSSLLAIQWLRADTLLGPENDSKVYFVKTVEFLDTFSSREGENLGEFLQNLSYSGRPPLYQLLSIPFLLVLGRSMDSAVTINLLFQALQVFSIFQTGKLISNAKTGFLAAILVSVYPPIVELARLYTPHGVLAACVSFALWRLAVLYHERSVKNIWLFMVALIFGVFIHPTFIFALWLPALVGSIYALFFQAEPRRPTNAREFLAWLKTKLADPIFVRGFLPSALLGVILVAGWYLSGEATLLNLLRTISTGQLGEFRGYEVFTKGLRLDGVSYFWWYLITMPNAISLVFTGFFVVGLGYTLWKRKSASLLLAATYLGTYLVFANLTTMTWLHFAEVLPVVALISVTWVGEINNRFLTAVLSAILIVTSLFVYVYVGWGTDRMAQAAIVMGAPITSKGVCQSYDQVFCPLPPSRDDWGISEILKTIAADPDCQPGRCGVLVLNPWGFEFTGYTFLYYETVEFPKSPLMITQMDGGAFGIVPFDFEALLQSSFIVYVSQKKPGQSYFGVATKLIQNPPESFALSHRELAKFKLPGRRTAVLVKRVAPLTLVEAEEVIRLIDLDEKYKFGQYRALAPLYVQAGQFEDALQAYQNALVYEPSDPVLYFGLAGVYEALGQMEDAARAYRQVIALAPGTDLALQSQAWLDRR